MNFVCPACGTNHRVPEDRLVRAGVEIACRSGAMVAGDLVRWVDAQPAARG